MTFCLGSESTLTRSDWCAVPVVSRSWASMRAPLAGTFAASSTFCLSASAACFALTPITAAPTSRTCSCRLRVERVLRLRLHVHCRLGLRQQVALLLLEHGVAWRRKHRVVRNLELLFQRVEVGGGVVEVALQFADLDVRRRRGGSFGGNSGRG